MIETRPAPPVPAETDLRSFAWIPLPVSFIQSNEWLCASGGGRAAMASLAVASWHQVPASSLPANDRALAALAQSGPEWESIKNEALAGWTECSDGRLYHPELSKSAINSMGKKNEQIKRTEAGRAKLAAMRAEISVTDSVTDPVTGSRREERRGEERR